MAKQKQIDRKYWEKYVYRYTMTVIEAYDGDTLVVNFDYGFKLKEGSPCSLREIACSFFVVI